MNVLPCVILIILISRSTDLEFNLRNYDGEDWHLLLNEYIMDILRFSKYFQAKIDKFESIQRLSQENIELCDFVLNLEFAYLPAHIKFIKNDAFKNFIYIKDLNLENNQIESFEQGIFNMLEN